MLIKIAKGIGTLSAMFCHCIFKSEPRYQTYAVGGHTNSFLNIRPAVKAVIGIFIIMMVIGAAILVGRIVETEYALSSFSASISREERLKTELMSVYASLKAPETFLDTLAKKGAASELVSIEQVRYITKNPIVQAQAIFK